MVGITLDNVREHNKPTDLWVVIENKIYDLTKFRNEHPGGEDTLDEVAGRDATKDFIDVGHSQEARDMMKKYYIGDLDAKNCKKLPLREICIAVGAGLIGVAASFLIKKTLVKK